MSASKKSKSKPSNSPAPATKSSATKTAAKKTNNGTTMPAVTPAPVATIEPPVPAPVARVAVTSVTTRPVQTTISARLDVGFGNALFLRGEGPGLSWEKGRAMECVQPDLWRLVLAESARAYTFKFLLNDTTWSAGPDFNAASGASVTVTPTF